MIKRLRIKFVCINMSIATVMLCVIFSLIIVFMGHGVEMGYRQETRQIIDSFMYPGPPEGAPEIWRPYFAAKTDTSGEIYAVQNQHFQDVEESTLLEYVAEVRQKEEKSGVLKEEKLYYMVRMSPLGEYVVLTDISNEMATMENLRMICALISFISFFTFLGISVMLAQWAVKPVETAWNQQRQFVADASHELKTPLTVIITNAELLQSTQYTQAERRRMEDSILTMSRQMKGLVASLLELARVDNGTAKMAFSNLNFSELVNEALLPFEPLFFERELMLESEVQQGLQVKGSGSHLCQVLDILLDNASKYTAPSGNVRVELKRQGTVCLLGVANPGEPMSREELKNIFKRFYRIDKARAMNHSYGLGLAIAQSIVKEHGGKIWAESADGINTFFVQLPLVN